MDSSAGHPLVDPSPGGPGFHFYRKPSARRATAPLLIRRALDAMSEWRSADSLCRAGRDDVGLPTEATSEPLHGSARTNLVRSLSFNAIAQATKFFAQLTKGIDLQYMAVAYTTFARFIVHQVESPRRHPGTAAASRQQIALQL
jgi:hypothetical protein